MASNHETTISWQEALHGEVTAWLTASPVWPTGKTQPGDDRSSSSWPPPTWDAAVTPTQPPSHRVLPADPLDRQLRRPGLSINLE